MNTTTEIVVKNSQKVLVSELEVGDYFLHNSGSVYQLIETLERIGPNKFALLNMERSTYYGYPVNRICEVFGSCLKFFIKIDKVTITVEV